MAAPWYSKSERPPASHAKPAGRRGRFFAGAFVIALITGLACAALVSVPPKARVLPGAGTRFPATLQDLRAGCTGDLLFTIPDDARQLTALDDSVQYDRLPPVAGSWTERPRPVKDSFSPADAPPLPSVMALMREGYVVIWYDLDADSEGLAQAYETVQASPYADVVTFVPVPDGGGLAGGRPFELGRWGHAKDCRLVDSAILDEFARLSLLSPLAHELRDTVGAVTQ